MRVKDEGGRGLRGRLEEEVEEVVEEEDLEVPGVEPLGEEEVLADIWCPGAPVVAAQCWGVSSCLVF